MTVLASRTSSPEPSASASSFPFPCTCPDSSDGVCFKRRGFHPRLFLFHSREEQRVFLPFLYFQRPSLPHGFKSRNRTYHAVIGIKHNVLKQCAGIHHTDDFKRISETIGNKILSAEGIHKSIGKEYFSLKKNPANAQTKPAI